MLGTELDEFPGGKNIGKIEFGSARATVAPIAEVHERAELGGEMVEGLIAHRGPVMRGLRLLNEPGLLGHDVHGEGQLADLGDEVLGEGGIFFLLAFEVGERGLQHILLETHGLEIRL